MIAEWTSHWKKNETVFKCATVKPTYTDIGQLRNPEHGLKIK